MTIPASFESMQALPDAASEYDIAPDAQLFGAWCPHGQYCKECPGRSMCKRSGFCVQKVFCRCGGYGCGSGFCKHGHRKYSCKQCKTGQCPHGRNKNDCLEDDCPGTNCCKHGRQRASRCAHCKKEKEEQPPTPVSLTIRKFRGPSGLSHPMGPRSPDAPTINLPICGECE